MNAIQIDKLVPSPLAVGRLNLQMDEPTLSLLQRPIFAQKTTDAKDICQTLKVAKNLKPQQLFGGLSGTIPSENSKNNGTSLK